MNGLALDFAEHGSQRALLTHDIVERVLQHLHIDRVAKLGGARDDVRGVSGLEVIDEPQPPLGKGNGELTDPAIDAVCRGRRGYAASSCPGT